MQKPSNTVVKKVQSADGTKIYADAVGNSTNPTLIFVHGFSSSATVFDNIFSNATNSKEFYLVSDTAFLSNFTSKVTINSPQIRYDVRGHGRSGKPNAEGHTSQRYAEDFAAVSEAFGVKNQIFVGWWVHLFNFLYG